LERVGRFEGGTLANAAAGESDHVANATAMNTWRVALAAAPYF
jgi:hypothetical protein